MQLNCNFASFLSHFMKIEQSILPQLGRTVGLLDMVVEDRAAKAGISLSKLQFVFLKIIANNNGKPQCNLAELTGRDKTTYTRNIRTLERKNLVERKVSKEDKRVKEVYITPTGKKYLEIAGPVISEIIDELESDITDEERTQFLNTLGKLKNKLLNINKKSQNLT